MTGRLVVSGDPWSVRVGLVGGSGELLEVALERRGHPRWVGTIYSGRVTRVLPGMSAAFVEIGLDRPAYLRASEAVAQSGSRSFAPIEEVLSQGAGILVQIARPPSPGKGVRVTAAPTLAGRFVVLAPGADGVSVSRRIEGSERHRLTELLEPLRPQGFGLIARTVAVGAGEAELSRDILALGREWDETRRRADRLDRPGPVREAHPLALAAVRDRLGGEVAEAVFDDAGEYARVVEWMELHDPDSVRRIRLEDGVRLFEEYDLERQAQAGLEPRVELPSGGSIVIESTEALVTIDVNTGSHVGGSSQEESALATNLEAVREIARQIRLRALGGLIVIDFVDLEDGAHRARVDRELAEALVDDPCRARAAPMTALGLVGITRKRSRGRYTMAMRRVCPCCAGRGEVPSRLSIRSSIWRRASAMRRPPSRLRVGTALADDLAGDEGLLKVLTAPGGPPPEVRADPELGDWEFELE